jgi:hypothetical protein
MVAGTGWEYRTVGVSDEDNARVVGPWSIACSASSNTFVAE